MPAARRPSLRLRAPSAGAGPPARPPNIVFIVGAQIPIIFLARRLAELVERAAAPAPAMAVVGGGTGPGDRAPGNDDRHRLGWLPFWAALPIAPAGIYIGAFLTTLLLQRLEPWLPVP